MFEFTLFGVRWRLSLLFPAMVTALLLWQSDSLAIPCVLASLIHEGGHLLAMLLLKMPPQDFTLSAFGARMRLSDRTAGYWQNLMISVCGPLANVLCMILFMMCRRPTLVYVHALLAGINLLPAIGLDGGEILRCLLCLIGFERSVPIILRYTSAVVLFVMVTMGVYVLLQPNGNGSLLIISVYLAAVIFFADKNSKNT